MTALNGPILFNSITGDDAAASGLGPATAQTGTGASITSASNVVTGITTTGVNAGDLLWVQSSTGRRFNIIASVDSGTQVTCDDNFDVTESGRTWAIGGKRASIAGSVVTLDDATADFHDGWIIQFESGYTESFTGRFRCRTGGVKFRTDPSASVPARLTTSYTSSPFVFGQGSGFLLQNIEFEQTNSSGSLLSSGSGGHGSVFKDCKFGVGSTIPTTCALSDTSWVFINCQFFASNECAYISGDSRFYNCIFNDSTDGIEFVYPSSANIIKDCIFDGCTNGINQANWGGSIYQWRSYTGNIFNCSNAGITVPNNNSLRQVTLIVKENIFANSTYGVEFASGMSFGTTDTGIYENNVFYNIGTSNYLNDDGGQVNDITLTADPFVDAAGGDFNLNATNGGGAVLRSTSINLGS